MKLYLEVNYLLTGRTHTLGDIFTESHLLILDEVARIMDLSLKDDYSVTKSAWKTEPHFIPLLTWLVDTMNYRKNVTASGSSWCKFLQVASGVIALLLEDFETPHKRKGLDLCFAFIGKLDIADLIIIDIEDKLYRQISCLTMLLAEVEVVEGAYACLFIMGSTLKNISAERSERFLNKVAAECLLAGLGYAHSLYQESYKVRLLISLTPRRTTTPH